MSLGVLRMLRTHGAADGRVVTGRGREIASLMGALEDDGPRILFIHGIAGVGKTTLLASFEAAVRAAGSTVIHVDGGELEPTERGFLSELGRSLGVEPDLDAIGARLAEISDRVIVGVDAYELLRLLDTWVRTVFSSSMPVGGRLILVGREQPATAWVAVDSFQTLQLGPLSAADAEEALVRAGFGSEQAARINRAVRGYPLGLAIASTTQGIDIDIVEATVQRVTEELTRTYLADAETLTRDALEAASVARRVTLPLLAAMIPNAAPQDAYERLRALPFVDARRDGLMVHESIATVVVGSLQAVDPERHRSLRRAAWRHLRSEVRTANLNELWRYTADMLYLIDNPIVREAFFPSSGFPLVVEAAKPADGPAIVSIACEHETPTGSALVASWWQRVPEAFAVVRDHDGTVVGFTCVLTQEMAVRNLVHEDPVVARWVEHLRTERMPKEQTALFHRWWLGAAAGEAPSPTQAATWLDLKRIYMEMRPRLRRVYGVVRAIDTYFPTFQTLGFAPLQGDPVLMDGTPNYCAVLDFGAASVDGWLARLAAAELGIEEQHLFDAVQREFVLDHGRVSLTPLEFEVMRHLSARIGAPVSRAELLRDVWGYDFDGSSNVVDVVVRSLRKKLGSRRAAIETIRGVGYRYQSER